MLRLLSALNWVQAALLAVVGVWFALVTLSVGANPFGAVVLVLCLALAAPFAYLGVVVDQGRGRGLQTALSVLALLAFPLGTLFGAVSLYVVWFSEAKTRFDAGAAVAEAADAADAADAPDAPDAADAADAATPGEAADGGVVDAWPEGESPYAFARRLADAGVPPAELRAQLQSRGLAPDEVETLLRAVGLARPGTERG